MGLELKSKVALDGSGFEAGINKLTHKAEEFAAGIGALFTAEAIAEVMKGLSERTIEFADKISEASRRLEVSTDFLQGFAYVAKKTGTSIEDLIGIMEKLRTAREGALTGRADNEHLTAFKRLGINETDLRTLSADKLLLKIGAAFQHGSVDTLLPAFREVGGRSAGALVNAMKEGLQKGIDEAKEAGAVMGTEQIATIKALKDELAAITQIITVQTGPALIAVMRSIIEAGFGLRTAFAFLSGGLGGVGGMARFAAQAVINPLTALQSLFSFNGGRAATEANASSRDAAAIMNHLADIIRHAAEELNHPPPTDLSGLHHAPEPPTHEEHEHKTHIPNDALVAVGNFLGTNAGQSLASIAERGNEILEGIRSNTADATQLLQSVQTGVDRLGNALGHGPGYSDLSLAFPP